MNLSQLKTWACAASFAAASALSLPAQANQVKKPATISVVASTVPSNGDVNPYGLVRIPRTSGSLVQGNLLVSNFNNSHNLQGTGTTIVQIAPDGTTTLFAQIDPSALPGRCPGGVGLTTALSVLETGWVIVGSLPTSDGSSPTAKSGCLLVLDHNGKVVETFYGSFINGPWDMTTFDMGSYVDLFVTNVLNGTVAAGGKVVHGGTVVRLTLTINGDEMPFLESATVIGSGMSERTDPNALVIGPTGVALDPSANLLYVADTLNNRITAIPDPLFRIDSAGVGAIVTQGQNLNGPLGLIVAPNGNILSVNGGNGLLVETNANGEQFNAVYLDKSGTPPGNGALFGLVDVGGSIYYVDDATNTLNLYQ
jgi:DNA-binding beta-propeller fold protein YncE